MKINHLLRTVSEKITAGAFVSFRAAMPANIIKRISFTNALCILVTWIDQSNFRSLAIEP